MEDNLCTVCPNTQATMLCIFYNDGTKFPLCLGFLHFYFPLLFLLKKNVSFTEMLDALRERQLCRALS